MAAPETKTVLPIQDSKKNTATEQQIDPWDVQAAHDEHGNILALDYVAISQCAQVPHFMAWPLTDGEQEMGNQIDRR